MYFTLLSFRVTESSHLDAAEQTDLPILIRSASESSLMRRQNSSASNRGDAMPDFAAGIPKAKVQEAADLKMQLHFQRNVLLQDQNTHSDTTQDQCKNRETLRKRRIFGVALNDGQIY
jgi:hypothetical protein